MTARIAPWMCWACGFYMDSATEITGKNAVPKDRDVCLCLNCAAPYEMRDSTWKPLTNFDGLPAEMARMLQRAQAVHGRMGFPDFTKRDRRA